MAADKDKKKRRDSSHDPDASEATSSEQADSKNEQESTEPVVRDKRRIDPETGEARETPNAQDPADQLTDEDLAKLLEEVPVEGDNDHLNDLKRVQAEYANYRKRVDRDRYVARELAIGEVITSVLPVLDDLDLAHAHGDLEGTPLELVAQKIRTIFGRYGLEQVGEVGEPFDPKQHEAVAQLPKKDATSDTIADVVQPGYKMGERLLRPAKVAVSVPEG